jgi:hypothetical protein
MANENVTSLAGVPSWMLVLIKRILEIKNAKTLKDVWPNLEVYFHGGVSFTPYQHLFENLFDNSQVAYMQLYSASEGFFGIQDEKVSNEMLLMLDYGIYYEFILVTDLNESNPKTYNLSEVQLHKNYSLLITTNAGLWRYQLGDTIQFTNLSPYRFIITGRTKQCINAFGEEVMIHNAEQAIKIACEKTKTHIIDYTVAPIFMDGNSGAHQWLIEFENEPEHLDYFIKILDDNLKTINSDYEAKRFNNYILQLPTITCLPKGTFYNWLKSNNKLGGQFKVPRLNNTRVIVDEILKSLK